MRSRWGLAWCLLIINAFDHWMDIGWCAGHNYWLNAWLCVPLFQQYSCVLSVILPPTASWPFENAAHSEKSSLTACRELAELIRQLHSSRKRWSTGPGLDPSVPCGGESSSKSHIEFWITGSCSGQDYIKEHLTLSAWATKPSKNNCFPSITWWITPITEMSFWCLLLYLESKLWFGKCFMFVKVMWGSLKILKWRQINRKTKI